MLGAEHNDEFDLDTIKRLWRVLKTSGRRDRMSQFISIIRVLVAHPGWNTYYIETKAWLKDAERELKSEAL